MTPIVERDHLPRSLSTRTSVCISKLPQCWGEPALPQYKPFSVISSPCSLRPFRYHLLDQPA